MIQTRFDVTALPKVKWAKRDLYWSPILKTKQACSICPGFKIICKGIQKFTLRYLTSNYLEQG